MKEIYLLGISRWKERRLKPFFPNSELIFIKSVDEIKSVMVWGNEEIDNDIDICRIEDGFIRSVSLGVDFSQPYSLIIDREGIYFNATKESDLENILNNYNFTPELQDRANRVKNYLVENRISKYNIYKDREITLNIDSSKKVLLVIGQVEGDASLVYGADSMKNIELLQSVYSSNSNSYIIYKPHPDVLNGNRLGNIEDIEVLKYCNRIEKEVSIDTLLSISDEVHTMTSLVGFEALLRDKKVVCYGIPFYAGWGLTIDMMECKRRKRELNISELIAGAYILYPKYIDPLTLKECEIERVLEQLAIEKELYHNSLLYQIKVKVKNFIYIKYYALLRHILKD